MYPFPKISLPESCWVSEDGLMIRLRFGSGGIVFCFSWTISRNESVRSMEGIFPDNEKNKNKRQVLLISTRNEYNVQVEDRLKWAASARVASAQPLHSRSRIKGSKIWKTLFLHHHDDNKGIFVFSYSGFSVVCYASSCLVVGDGIL